MQGLFLFAFERDAVNAAAQRPLIRRLKVQQALVFVQTVKVGYFPLAGGDLAQQISLHVVEVDVVVSALFARPDKAAAVFEESQVVVDVYVPAIYLVQQQLRLARSGIGQQQLQVILMAIHVEDTKLVGVLRPFDAGYIKFISGVQSYFYAFGFRQMIDEDAHL